MLIQSFIHHAQQQPQALALQEAERSLSYQQLLQQALQLAHNLQNRGMQTGQRVAVHLPRGLDASVVVLAILLAGGCYVPLDVKNPPQRLAFIVEDADVALVVGGGAAPSWLNAELWLDVAAHVASEIPLLVSEITTQPNQLAAILYTSGSTGQPRGVALSHVAIAAFSDWASELVKLTPQDRIASTAPLFFDLSTFDLYAVLNAGASLHFVPQALTMAPSKLSAWLAEQRISGWYTVPSLLAFLAYKGNLPQSPLPDLRFVLFAGEVFPTPSLMLLTELLPHIDLYNLFGPTETNVCCYWPVDRQRLQAEQPIPIGYAASGCELRISEQGELLVRGANLASGYWSKGQLIPLTDADGWYATGDKVSLQNGEYQFHGRMGRMLKCSGYRVEPAEIEAVINAVAGVKTSAVLGVDDATAGQRPAVVVVLDEAGSVSAIRAALSQKLPAYMQPSRYLVLADLPLLANGKLDYQTLQSQLEASA